MIKLLRLWLTLSYMLVGFGEEKGTPKPRFSKKIMGTEVLIIVDAPMTDALKKATDSAFREGIRLNMLFSDYEANSELSLFSQSSKDGRSVKLSDELFKVLEYGQELSRMSDGAFDVTLGPLTRLWRIARFRQKLPKMSKLRETRQRTGYQKLVLNRLNTSGNLLVPGMVLDLGGIAKGYVADRMLEAMKNRGFAKCLIDAGGDLTIGDAPKASKGWRVEIGGRPHPELPVLELSNCAVATSGDLEQNLEINGTRYSHLLNPKTGVGLKGSAQVTVVAPTGMVADSIASTCLVLGMDKASLFLAQTSALKMYYLTENNSSIKVHQYLQPL